MEKALGAEEEDDVEDYKRSITKSFNYYDNMKAKGVEEGVYFVADEDETEEIYNYVYGTDVFGTVPDGVESSVFYIIKNHDAMEFLEFTYIVFETELDADKYMKECSDLWEELEDYCEERNQMKDQSSAERNLINYSIEKESMLLWCSISVHDCDEYYGIYKQENDAVIIVAYNCQSLDSDNKGYLDSICQAFDITNPDYLKDD